jgi:hypothetical protein
MNLDVLAQDGLSASEAPFEPDTICDLIAEHVSHDLQQFYFRQ